MARFQRSRRGSLSNKSRRSVASGLCSERTLPTGRILWLIALERGGRVHSRCFDLSAVDAGSLKACVMLRAVSAPQTQPQRVRSPLSSLPACVSLSPETLSRLSRRPDQAAHHTQPAGSSSTPHSTNSRSFSNSSATAHQLALLRASPPPPSRSPRFSASSSSTAIRARSRKFSSCSHRVLCQSPTSHTLRDQATVFRVLRSWWLCLCLDLQSGAWRWIHSVWVSASGRETLPALLAARPRATWQRSLLVQSMHALAHSLTRSFATSAQHPTLPLPKAHSQSDNHASVKHHAQKPRSTLTPILLQPTNPILDLLLPSIPRPRRTALAPGRPTSPCSSLSTSGQLPAVWSPCLPSFSPLGSRARPSSCSCPGPTPSPTAEAARARVSVEEGSVGLMWGWG